MQHLVYLQEKALTPKALGIHFLDVGNIVQLLLF
jgi:hypothetical protein